MHTDSRALCVLQVQELDLNRNYIRPEGARAIAALCTVSHSLTTVRLSLYGSCLI